MKIFRSLPAQAIKASMVLFLMHAAIWGLSQNYEIGYRNLSLTDTSRNNREISTRVYYPSEEQGMNTPVADGVFPVISFGHGFLMNHEAYSYLWEALIPDGYILAFANTETGFSPDHLDFGLDMVFVLEALLAQGQDPESGFFGHISGQTLVMGHSMGGGCSYVGLDASGFEASAVVSFAASGATNPSAIEAAAQVNIPNLVFAGQNDSVTPTYANQLPIYNNSASFCKTYINILGGAHCYFADVNFTCDIGETLAGSNPTISREEQHNIILTFLQPFLEHYLKNETGAWNIFTDLLFASEEVDFLIECATPVFEEQGNFPDFTVGPNPTTGNILISPKDALVHHHFKLVLYNAHMQPVKQQTFSGKQSININIRDESPGVYFLQISDETRVWNKKFIKR
jgi:predicted dienelactone hydrolase